MRGLVFSFLISLTMLSPCYVYAADKELNILTWSDYMDEENMPKDFEKETGIKVRLDFYESNEEMIAKLQAGGASQYDIIVPSDFIMSSLINLKLIQPLDHSKIPNLVNLSEEFKNTTFDSGNIYSAGWQWGTIGLLYDKTKISELEASSWSIIFDSAKKSGSFALIDSVREMLGITLLYLGYDFNSIDPNQLKKAAELLIKTKKRKNCIGFKGGVGGRNEVISGSANIAIVYNGDGITAVYKNPKRFGFIVPKEGSEIWLDSMCIPAKAPNTEAAHKWINWVLKPKVGAALTNYNYCATPNQAALPYIDKKVLEDPGIWPTPEIMDKLVFCKDLKKDIRIIDEIWTRIKSH